MSTMKPRTKIVLAAGLLGVLAWAGAGMMSDNSRFDAETWKSGANRAKSNPRYEMADAVVKQQIKPGMTREQVVALLGPPDRQQADNYSYLIGAGDLGVDGEGVVVAFDGQGRVTRAFITRY